MSSNHLKYFTVVYVGILYGESALYCIKYTENQKTVFIQVLLLASYENPFETQFPYPQD